MDEDTVIETLRGYLEGQFPKKCPSCGMVFNSLSEYIKNTSKFGDPVSFEVETNEWEPTVNLGTYIFANCKCGSKLSLSLKDMDWLTKVRLIGWVRIKASKRGIPVIELFRHLRSEVRRRVLNESDEG